MKRTILVFLLALALAGCAAKETAPPISDPVKQEIPSWHAPNAQLHTAVQAYRPDDTVSALMPLDDCLLVVGDSALTLLNSDGVPVATVPTAGVAAGQCVQNGYGCYLPDANAVQLFDGQLQITGNYPLPEQPDDIPVLAPDGKTVYYCVGPEIRVYDLELKITRKLRFTTCMEQKLTGIWLDGSILSCAVTYDADEASVIYVSTADGAITHTDSAIDWLTTDEESYMLQRMDGSVRQLISGSTATVPNNLVLPEADTVFPAIELGAMVALSPDHTLALYDVSSGKQMAKAALSDSVEILCTAVVGNYVWFTDGQLLYRWDVNDTPSQEETVYKTPLYTRENPDVDGMSLCQSKADALFAKHGVQILFGASAVENPGEFVPESEYQIPDITAMLNAIEAELPHYPADFLKTSSKNPVQLCIVRSVSGEKQPVFYWNGVTPQIYLPVGCDVADGLAMGMGYVVNSRVVSSSTKADKWVWLNPKNFDYGDVPEEKYLKGEERAFADAMSATSATEDRSRIFHQAMKPDNADAFQSETMQKKLEMFCTAIRDTFGWKKSTESYPWEQYLAQSLAYQK